MKKPFKILLPALALGVIVSAFAAPKFLERATVKVSNSKIMGNVNNGGNLAIKALGNASFPSVDGNTYAPYSFSIDPNTIVSVEYMSAVGSEDKENCIFHFRADNSGNVYISAIPMGGALPSQCALSASDPQELYVNLVNS